MQKSQIVHDSALGDMRLVVKRATPSSKRRSVADRSATAPRAKLYVGSGPKAGFRVVAVGFGAGGAVLGLLSYWWRR